MNNGTKVYGESDDLIEFDGDVSGEVSCFGTDDADNGVLLIFSDGTLIEVKYGKASLAVWGIQLIAKGSLFISVEPCIDEHARPHSDVATFAPGLKWCNAAKDWERVR